MITYKDRHFKRVIYRPKLQAPKSQEQLNIWEVKVIIIKLNKGADHDNPNKEKMWEASLEGRTSEGNNNSPKIEAKIERGTSIISLPVQKEKCVLHGKQDQKKNNIK